MIWIGKFLSVQQATIQQPDQQEAKGSVPLKTITEELKNSEIRDTSSTNTWQRASLIQDGAMQRHLLNDQLKVEHDYDKAKQETESIKLSHTETKQNDLRNQMESIQKEVERLQEELKEIQDSSFIETISNWMFGSDGDAEMKHVANGANPLKKIAEQLTPKYDPDKD